MPFFRLIEGEASFFAATGATERHGGNMAYYSVSSDHVQTPPLESFRDAESYYATFAHEMAHRIGARRASTATSEESAGR
jgi:antirestriction protein ArdC